MPRVIINQDVIEFPNSGTDPNWAQGVIDFAQAVEAALRGLASSFDISPRVQTLSNDVNVNLPVSDVVFPSSSVRSFSFNYSIYRSNGVLAIAETGFVNGVFNTLELRWDLEHSFSGPKQASGEAYNTFAMSGDQLVLNTVGIGGSYDSTNSKISYAAKTILVNNIVGS